MRLHVPCDLAKQIYIDFDITYDVVATGGPPDPPLDVRITGFFFVERWRCTEEGSEILDTFEDYTNLDNQTDSSPYDDFICEFIEKYSAEIRRLCREFELTSDDSMI